MLGLGVTGKRDLYVSAGIHRAVVNVDEDGTEAAAATGVILTPRDFIFGPQLICDHPASGSLEQFHLIKFTHNI